jgi:hypothetical protein
VESLVKQNEPDNAAGHASEAARSAFMRALEARVDSATGALHTIKQQHGLASFFVPNSWLSFTPHVRAFPLKVAVSDAVARAEAQILVATAYQSRLASPGEKDAQQWLHDAQAYLDGLKQFEQEYAHVQTWQTPAAARGQEAQIVKHTRALISQYDDSLFSPNAVLTQLHGLTRQFHVVEDDRANLQAFRTLLACIKQTQTVLEAPESQCVAVPEFHPGDAFSDVLTAIQTSALLGPALRADIEAEGQARFRQLKDEMHVLQASQASQIGPLLQPGQSQPPLKLSDAVVHLGDALAQWLQQPFIAVNGGGTSARHGLDTACRFDGDTPHLTCPNPCA